MIILPLLASQSGAYNKLQHCRAEITTELLLNAIYVVIFSPSLALIISWPVCNNLLLCVATYCHRDRSMVSENHSLVLLCIFVKTVSVYFR